MESISDSLHFAKIDCHTVLYKWSYRNRKLNEKRGEDREEKDVTGGIYGEEVAIEIKVKIDDTKEEEQEQKQGEEDEIAVIIVK